MLLYDFVPAGGAGDAAGLAEQEVPKGEMLREGESHAARQTHFLSSSLVKLLNLREYLIKVNKGNKGLGGGK